MFANIKKNSRNNFEVLSKNCVLQNLNLVLDSKVTIK